MFLINFLTFLIDKKSLIVFMVLLSIPINLGCTEEPDKKPLIEKLSGEMYWSFFAIEGGLKNVRENKNGQVTGEMMTMHGYVPFIANKSEIEKPGARVAGYIVICEDFASRLDRKHDLEGQKLYRSQLKKLTGVEFKSSEDFREWLKANREFLRFSKKLNRLEVIKKDTNK